MLLAERDVLRVGCLISQAESQRVGARPRDHIQGVDHVPERLRHLAPLWIPDQPMDDGVPERNVMHEEEPAHDHASDPEIEDLVAGDQRAGRIKEREVLCLFGPPEG